MPPLMEWSDRPLSCGLGCGLWRLLGLLFRGELLLHLGGDGIGVHFVSGGGILEERWRDSTARPQAGCLTPPAAGRAYLHRRGE